MVALYSYIFVTVKKSYLINSSTGKVTQFELLDHSYEYLNKYFRFFGKKVAVQDAASDTTGLCYLLLEGEWVKFERLLAWTF